MSTLLNAIKEAIPSATLGTMPNTSRKQPVTLDDARKNVVKKLTENVAFVENDFEAENGKKPDLVFKESFDGTYHVGAKYGNRWLALDAKNNSIGGIQRGDLAKALTAVKGIVENGKLDKPIGVVLESNRDRAKKMLKTKLARKKN